MLAVEKIQTDVLVIGSGTAGLAAATYAALEDKQVLILDKGALGRSGSSTGAVQIAGLGDWSHEEDDTERYLEDIYTSGRGLSNPNLAKTLVHDIDQRIQDLIDWGLKLDREGDQVSVSHTSGHSLPRSVSAKKGKAGLGLLHTLRKKVTKDERITTLSDVMTIKLIKSDERVVGALVLELSTNKFFLIQSKATVLATGGAGQLYPITSNPVQSTGDGFSLGLQAGATLIDMEQVQFYPVSIIEPQSIAGLCISFYHYSKLFNNKGERFMKYYAPDTLEDATRDTLSIAIATEISEGRGPIWLDATDVIDQVKKEFPHEYQLCLDRGVDLANKRAQVGPAAHFMMGGVRIDADAKTDVEGLFVAGETAGGLHGGNRLGNNALSECLVFGARAGMNAAKLVDDVTVSTLDANPIRINQYGNHRPFEIKQHIQHSMSSHVEVIRTNEGLREALNQLLNVREQLENVQISNPDVYSREIVDYIEAQHMVNTAEAIVRSALERQESRGSHYNTDYPDLTSTIKHNLVRMKNHQFQVQPEEVESSETKR